MLPDPIPQVKLDELVDEWSNESRGGWAGSGAVPPPIADSGISEAFMFSDGVDEAAGGDGPSSGCGSPDDSASRCHSLGGRGSSRDWREGN